MTHASSSYRSAITLDQLIALNDEIAALVRAGVPLGAGLRSLSEDLPGELGKVSQKLAEGIERGESLATVLDQRRARFPPVYRAVVESGIRSGRLAAALEAIASSARRLAETRRMVTAGFLYPLLVLLLAWVLLIFFVRSIAPGLLALSRDFGVSSHVMLDLVAWLRGTAHLWGPAVPMVVVLAVAGWWSFTSRCAMLQTRWADVLLGWFPWLRSMLRSFRVATFADVLAMLLENGVPLDQSLPLAAEAVGDPKMVRAAGCLAESLRKGEPLDCHQAVAAGFFPLFAWSIAAGHRQGALPSALRHAATLYRRRAESQAEAARVFLPVLLTVLVAGTVTLAFGLLVFGPWISLLHTIALP